MPQELSYTIPSLPREKYETCVNLFRRKKQLGKKNLVGEEIKHAAGGMACNIEDSHGNNSRCHHTCCNPTRLDWEGREESVAREEDS